MDLTKGTYLGFIKSKTVLQSTASTVRVSLSKKDLELQQEQNKQAEREAKKPEKKVKFADEVESETKLKPEQKSLLKDLEDDFIDSDDDNTAPISTEKPKMHLDEEDIENEGPIMDDEDDVGLAIEREMQKRKKNFDFKRKSLNRAPERASDYDLPSNFSRNQPTRERGAPPVSKESKEILEKESHLANEYGVGMKILKSLGFKAGEGIGKYKQGIVNPIEGIKQTVIGGNKALADRRSKIDSMLEDIKVNLTSEEEDEEEEYSDDDRRRKRKNKKKEEHKGWRQPKSQLKYLKKTHERLKQTEDDFETTLSQAKPITQQKVLDMRGAEAVVYESYSAIVGAEKPKHRTDEIRKIVKKASYMAEVPLVLRTALDKAKYIIQGAQSKINAHRDSITVCLHEIEEKQKENDELKAETEALVKFSGIIRDMETNFKKMVSEEILNTFEDLLLASPKLFCTYSIEKSFVEKISLKIREEHNRIDFNNAEEIQDLVKLLREVQEFLKDVLKNQAEVKYSSFFDNKSSFKESKLDVYDQKDLDELFGKILQSSLFPAIRTYVINDWKPDQIGADADALLDFLRKNQDLIPESVRADLYDNYLMPKLERTVEDWNPTKDLVPIHVWVHPWLGVIDSKRLSKLWVPIQFKVSQALQQWEPSDNSAFMLLTPWFKVFDIQNWENIIMKCIMPKLYYPMIHDLSVNPDSPNIEPLQWLLTWQEYIPIDNLRTVIESCLMKRLNDQWQEWIRKKEVPKERMLDWLNGWKGLLGPRITKLASISKAFENMEKQV